MMGGMSSILTQPENLQNWPAGPSRETFGASSCFLPPPNKPAVRILYRRTLVKFVPMDRHSWVRNRADATRSACLRRRLRLSRRGALRQHCGAARPAGSRCALGHSRMDIQQSARLCAACDAGGRVVAFWVCAICSHRRCALADRRDDHSGELALRLLPDYAPEHLFVRRSPELP